MRRWLKNCKQSRVCATVAQHLQTVHATVAHILQTVHGLCYCGSNFANSPRLLLLWLATPLVDAFATLVARIAPWRGNMLAAPKTKLVVATATLHSNFKYIMSLF